MAAGDDLPLPLEIPWQLAASTQVLTAGDPDETTISLFTFQPDDEVLTGQFPGRSLVFLKAALTISPATLPPGSAPVAAAALGEGIPCYHVLLDMKVRKSTGELGTSLPYFHAAAPMRRQMLQTGVVGAEVFEGESDGQFMGKSGSQLFETSSSHSSTTSDSAGATLLGVGISGSSSTTGVAGSRNVKQVSDSTTREASQERRELVSHMTNVANVLTLLNAKYIGTPYVRFSLWPRPLEQLSADPSDPSLWFGQLLQRCSSGIEGVQEFTTVIVVPKGQDFCVEARLRRVCLLDDPPSPTILDEPFSFQATALSRLLDYLSRRFPIGTPLDDLDVDYAQALSATQFPLPAIEFWVISVPGWMSADVVSPNPALTNISRGSINYKTFLELWLEMLRDEYDRDLNRSPLERGALVGETRQLDACFSFGPGGVLNLSTSHTSVSPLALMPIGPRDLDVGGLPASSVSTRASVKARALETITRWNALERRLAVLLGNPHKPLPDKPGGLNDVRVIRVLVDRWAKMHSEDPRNLSFEPAMEALKLPDKQQRLLKSAGITDLKGLARALKAAPIIERYNGDIERRPKDVRAGRAKAPAAKPIKFTLSSKDAALILKQIGVTLFGEVDTPDAH